MQQTLFEHCPTNTDWVCCSMSQGTSEIQDVLCQYLLHQPLLHQPSIDAVLWHRLRAVNKEFSRVTEMVPPKQLVLEALQFRGA